MEGVNAIQPPPDPLPIPDVPCCLVFVQMPTPTDQEFADLATRLTDRLNILLQRQFKRAEEGLLHIDLIWEVVETYRHVFGVAAN